MVCLGAGWKLHTPNCPGRLLQSRARGSEGVNLVSATFPEGLTNESGRHHCILTLQNITQVFFEMLNYACFLVKKGTLSYYWWEWRFMQPLWEAVWRYLKELKMDLPFDSASHLWDYIQRIQNTNSKEHKLPKFIAVLFTIAKIWKLPKCPSVDECIKPTMEHLHNGILLGRKKE